MKKRLISLFCAAMLLLSVTACASDSKASTVTEATSSSTNQSTIASAQEQTTATVPAESGEEPTATTAQTTTAKEITPEPFETSAVTSGTTTAVPEETTTAVTSATTKPADMTTATTTVITTTAVSTTATTVAPTTTAPKENEPKPVVSAKVYEAEDAKLHGGLSVANNSSCSGGKAVERFENDSDYISFTIDIPVSGAYDITFVSSGIGSYKENNAYIDGSHIGMFTSESEKLTNSIIPAVSLSKGTRDLRITKSWGWIQLDCIKVEQSEGIDDAIYNVSNKLVNENANKRTQDLFNYLCDCYGEYVLSGQVCDDGLSGREFAAIHNVTGKYPAILGLDMMDYTPSRTELGARSHAIETAIDFSEHGGIVSFCWHWNAPTEYLKDGNDSDNGSPRWWGGFYTRNSTFDISAVMNGNDAAGKAALDRDIAEIAKQLKRLDNAGVPVLWRPLHEASGGWFWWGAQGADAFKKLWIYLYEQLTYEYECNNLIWVFNGQNGEWYPGDDYVDIIGEDIYPGERVYSPQTARFTQATEYSSTNKIVALTENGCIFDIDQAVEINAMWAWFNTWCGDFVLSGSSYSEKFTEKEILKKAYLSEYVITLDELDW